MIKKCREFVKCVDCYCGGAKTWAFALGLSPTFY